MQSITAFLHIAKINEFWWKTDDVGKTQELCRAMYMFFESYLGKV